MRICVFCGSKPGAGSEYVKAARHLGRLLAQRSIGLVYGGGSVGLMGEVADATLDAGGEVIGVIPYGLFDREVAHRGLTDMRVVADMHERKATMAALSDGFIALPGGAGTMEELFEVWTWGQLGLHIKPCALLDVDGYYRQLHGFLDHMVDEEFLVTAYRQMLTLHTDPIELLEYFANYQPPRQKYEPTGSGPDSVDSLAWLHIRDRRLLMVRTRGKELFYLPGGKREPGESDVQALTREIQEELGVTLHADSFSFQRSVTATADGFDDGRQVTMLCYTAAHGGDPAPGREIAELTWTGTADATRCPPAGQRVLAYLHSRGLID